MTLPQPTRTLNHFSLFAFTDAYWLMNEHAKASFHEHWLAGLAIAAPNFDIYQTTDPRADLLLWCVLNAAEPHAAADFFEKLANITTPYRHWIQPVESLWGFTRPSAGSNGASTQEIDPFSTTRMRYLVAYPVAKSGEAKLASGEAEEPLKIGERYPDIKQLVLYSFGLDDRKFLVVYETEDLLRFSDLLTELRHDPSNRFLLQDTPVYTAIYHPAPQTLALWK